MFIHEKDAVCEWEPTGVGSDTELPTTGPDSSGVEAHSTNAIGGSRYYRGTGPPNVARDAGKYGARS